MLVDPSLTLVNFPATTSTLERLNTETLRMLAKVSINHTKVTNVDIFSIVTSKWHYSHDSQLARQDKDFKRLNKSALGNRATTAHVSINQ